jgi:hypothetical protein
LAKSFIGRFYDTAGLGKGPAGKRAVIEYPDNFLIDFCKILERKELRSIACSGGPQNIENK